MIQTPSHEDDLAARRKEALHRLCKGRGLTAGAVARLDDMAELFGSPDPLEVIDRIEELLSAHGDDRDMRALANALAVGDSADTSLTGRRDTYAAAQSISQRTLAKYEAAGVATLARLLSRSVSNAADAQRRAAVVDILRTISDLGLDLTDVAAQLTAIAEASADSTKVTPATLASVHKFRP